MKRKKDIIKQSEQGFTMVEVTLALAFISMLLISIATITTNISALYRKGITLKTLNSVGRNLVTELTGAINDAPSIDSTNLCNGLMSTSDAMRDCKADNAYRFVYQSIEGQVHDDLSNIDETIQYGGVFCTGSYSYVWNTFYGRENLNSPNNYAITLIYNNGIEKNKELKDFKLIRFKDKTYRACATNIDKAEYNKKVLNKDNRRIDITKLSNGMDNIVSDDDIRSNFLSNSDEEIDEEKINDYSNSDALLDLYELVIFHPAQDIVTLRGFFAGTFILATDRGDVNVVRSGEYCNVSNYQGDTASSIFDLGSEFNYCGINKFNFAARTAGNGI